MSYSIEFTDTAKRDLHNIAFYIANESKNKETANKWIRKLENHCSKLESYPSIGAIPNDRFLTSLGYRFLTYGEYLIFYSVDENYKKIFIQAFFNAKRDYTRFMKNI